MVARGRDSNDGLGARTGNPLIDGGKISEVHSSRKMRLQSEKQSVKGDRGTHVKKKSR